MVVITRERRQKSLPCRPFRRQVGFSMIELLVVLVVLGLLAGVSAPPLGRYFENLEYRKQVGEVTAVLRYARLAAVTSGKEVRLTLETGENSTLRLAGAMDELRPTTTDKEGKLVIYPEEIVFHPEGRATPARLTFTRGERSRTILVDALTGLPVLEERRENSEVESQRAEG
jgi:general secretion pathway protein H